MSDDLKKQAKKQAKKMDKALMEEMGIDQDKLKSLKKKLAKVEGHPPKTSIPVVRLWIPNPIFW
jgi:cell division FtsZ-interacting protein ZapD